jgi:hypothetical protein
VVLTARLLRPVRAIGHATVDHAEHFDGCDGVVGSPGQAHLGLVDDGAELAVDDGVHELELDVFDCAPQLFNPRDRLVPAEYIPASRSVTDDLFAKEFMPHIETAVVPEFQVVPLDDVPCDTHAAPCRARRRKSRPASALRVRGASAR